MIFLIPIGVLKWPLRILIIVCLLSASRWFGIPIALWVAYKVWRRWRWWVRIGRYQW
jgi:hypothetical protein